ncbi:MAG: hypothetical protein CVU67_04090, partial [Deltaproteobacteria bacterium HGW-Deltaproteobacteria-24]
MKKNVHNNFYIPQIQKRNRLARRFKYTTLAAVILSLSFLGFFLFDIIKTGTPAFQQSYVKVDIAIDEETAQNPYGIFDRDMSRLISRAWLRSLPQDIAANPEWIGTTQTFWALLNAEADQHVKGKYSRLSDAQKAKVEELILKVDRHINNKIESEKLICSTQLLQQYKNTVDRSSIVSKTDPRGVITYVNEAFCRISGYKEEELLGKPHNLVRHPDMKASVFKEMWNTLKKRKEPWIGEVKNKKKDGSAYWVQTIINPILDANGKILEYIGIRTDVTDIEKTKEYLQKQFSITKDNFADVMMLSKLYEEAMNKSNIILRVNKDKNVVYANDLFYKLMGYTPKELIGKPYSTIKRPDDINDEDIEKIWEGVEKENIWKGELRNISKKGKMYHFISTVVPIKNAKGEILEYMGIRQDISEVVELHEELEATQREIVYKMGEIGETRSKETGNHVKRVAEYSKLLAELCGLSSKEADILFTASPMHDIGKVGIPDAILNKPGR